MHSPKSKIFTNFFLVTSQKSKPVEQISEQIRPFSSTSLETARVLDYCHRVMGKRPSRPLTTHNGTARKWKQTDTAPSALVYAFSPYSAAQAHFVICTCTALPSNLKRINYRKQMTLRIFTADALNHYKT
jgi:hypothetical protein